MRHTRRSLCVVLHVEVNVGLHETYTVKVSTMHTKA